LRFPHTQNLAFFPLDIRAFRFYFSYVHGNLSEGETLNLLDRVFLKFLLPRIFVHWKSSTAGIATTIALVTLFQHSYKAGMSWEQWICAVLPGAIGIIMQDVKAAKVTTAALLALVFCFGASGARAQSSSLPGWKVSINAGYSLTQGDTTNNGIFSSATFALPQPKSWKDFGLAMRGDYFTITSPAVYVVDFGPEVRATPFSVAGILNGAKFQPFLNAGFGFARSQASVQSLAAASHFAFKIGGGVDMPVSSTVNWRLLEVDYIRSNIFPGGSVVLSNVAQVETGIGITF
jgi:hypothetical protein